MDARVTLVGGIWFLATCLTLASFEVRAGQEGSSGAPTVALGDGRPSPSRVTFEGFVLLPDGSPVEGAVVVSSAGGRTVTDVAGSYRLEVEVPLGAASVQVTAVGRAGDNLAASATVPVSATTPPTRVDLSALPRRTSCSPSWIPTFGGEPGTDAGVYDLAVFDDGGGPALYIGGSFSSAGGVPASRIAKWDGSSWSALGSGLSGTNAAVYALEVHDDGSGPALYAGGTFTTAGGVPANNLAKWDGSSWSALGSGSSETVEALAVYDDSSGPALFAGGRFQTAGGDAVHGIGKWDGSNWSELAGGPAPGAYVLAAYDDGGGSELYAGGQFWSAGGVPAAVIAKWNGSSWSALGSGLIVGDEDEDTVYSLAVYDDGGGPALYVGGGGFVTPGGASLLAKWDGSSWTDVGGGVNGSVGAMAVYDDGGGPALYVSGGFTVAGGVPASHIARWDGSSWTGLGTGTNEYFGALAVFDDGRGAALHAIHGCTSGGCASGIARWDGASWTALGSGMSEGMNGLVESLAVHDDGSRPALYAGGGFSSVGGVAASRIASWDGSSWTALGSGMDGSVRALAVHDDGNGPALHAGGLFTSAGGVAASRIARWDGASWAPLGGGMNGDVLALVVHDDGNGPALFAGGSFTTAGGVAANRIGRWDGSTWTPLGSGVSGSASTVAALAVYDDGSGPALFAGGRFTSAGGVTANRIARWDGASWTPLGGGLAGSNSSVAALAVHDDGRGPALYAGGSFTIAGGAPASRIARWDGSSWSVLASGMSHDSASPRVTALAAYDDGGGPALYAGGNFTGAGGVAANRIARWNGSSWSALGGGVGGNTNPSLPAVLALVVHDDDGRPALFAGGSFSSALDSGDSYLAKWGCLDARAPVLACPSSIDVPDRVPDGPGEVVSFTVTAYDDLDPSPAVECVPPSGSTFPPGTTRVACTATDASGNQATCQFPVTVTHRARPR